jgi:hypothetical protein
MKSNSLLDGGRFRSCPGRIGIEFAKEVLKAVYQYSALLNRLRVARRRRINAAQNPA